MLTGIVCVIEQLCAQLDQPLPEKGKLSLVHVVALRRLQKVLIGQFLDFFCNDFCCDALGCHAPPFPATNRKSCRAKSGIISRTACRKPPSRRPAERVRETPARSYNAGKTRHFNEPAH